MVSAERAGDRRFLGGHWSFGLAVSGMPGFASAGILYWPAEVGQPTVRASASPILANSNRSRISQSRTTVRETLGIVRLPA
jgi:hypothetical protein